MSELECTKTDDALQWAQDFIQCKNENGWTEKDIDVDLMLGWFANAIECACDVRIGRGDYLIANTDQPEDQNQ